MSIESPAARGEVTSHQTSGQLDRYPHLHSVCGDLLGRAGRAAEAADAFGLAAELTHNDSERGVFLSWAAYLSGVASP